MKTTVQMIALSAALLGGAEAAPRPSRCPPGYRRVDHKSCLLETKKDPNADCPNGFDLIGDSVDNYKCRRMVKSSIDRICASGFELSEDGVTCTKTLEKQGRFFCKNSDFTLSDDKATCTKKENEPARPVCEKDGFKLTTDKKRCQSVRKDDVSFKCQGEDFSLKLSDKTCRKRVVEAATPFCQDEDFSFNGKTCVAKFVKPLNFKCEGNGFKLSNDEQTCSKTLREDAERFCEDPAAKLRMESQKCVLTEEREVRFKCAEGFEPVGGQGAAACKKVLTKEPERQCQEGQLVDGKCRITEIKPATRFCESSELTLSENEKYCRGTESKPAEKLCNGNTEQNGKCFDKEILEKVFNCAKGYKLTDLPGKDDNPLCKSTNCDDKKCLYQDAHLVCPEGTMENGAGKCVKLTPVEFEFICDQGKLSGRKCITDLKEPSSAKCSKGYQLIDEDAENPRCRLIRFVAAELICKPSDSYSLNTMTKLCERTLIRDIIPFCAAEGFKLTDNRSKCIRQTISASKLRCNGSGFTLVKTQCLKTISKPSVSFCKLALFKEQNGQCVKNASRSPSFRCEKQSQTLKGDECVSFITKDAIAFCEKEGFALNDTETACLKTVFAAISFTCENVGSGNLMLDGKRCIRVVTKNSNFECVGDGYKRVEDSNICEKTLTRESRPVCPLPGTKLSDDQTFCFTFKFADVELSCDAGLNLVIKKGPICFRRDVRAPIYE